MSWYTLEQYHVWQQLWHDRKVDGFVMQLGVMVHARTVSCVAAAMAREKGGWVCDATGCHGTR